MIISGVLLITHLKCIKISLCFIYIQIKVILKYLEIKFHNE